MKLEYIKGCLKGKVKVTQALLVAFFITGGISFAEEKVININITNVGEQTGLELGENSRARGNGAIATGKNSVAIGKNAVATGNGENKETIEAKIAEDKQKLADIENSQAELNRKTNELATKQARERETIEAGIRVEQIQKAKEKAKLKWQEDLQKYNTEVKNSEQFLKDYQVKIDDLNSRLEGMSKIPNIDISSEEGLNKAATELKQIAEKGTNLNLSNEFYKTYVKNYYKALGDLRKKEIIYSKTSEYHYCSELPGLNENNIINSYQDLYEFNYFNRGIKRNSSNVSFDASDGTMYSSAFEKCAGIKEQPKHNLVSKNVDTDITTEEEYQTALQEAPIFKKAMREFWKHNNNKFLTEENKMVFSEIFDKKVDIRIKQYEITYYQYMYEKTKSTLWLDKKKNAIEEHSRLVEEFEKLPQANSIVKENINNWKKENITDVKEKNKITVEKLTSELEQALGINKNAVQNKEKELEELKNKAEQERKNYEGLNPTESDLILAREYERVKKEIDDLSNEIVKADERLKALKEALTLHDLTNIGENQIALGTDSLAVGNNAIAFGTSAATVGENSISIGKESTTTGEASISLGVKNVTVGNKSVNIGYGNLVKGNNNFILGSHIDASKIENAVVLGNNSVGETGTVSVGAKGTERKIIHVADGIVNKDSKDAVNGSQLYSLANNPANFSGFDTNNWKKALGVGNVDISNLAKKDGSNIEVDHYITKLSNGASLENPTNKLVTDTIVKGVLDTKADKTEVITIKNSINQLAKTDLSNVENSTIMRKIDQGNITSSTLEVGGTGKVLSSNITLEIKDGAITKAKLDNTLKAEIEGKANKTDVYSKTETYNKTEIDNLVAGKVSAKTMNDTLSNYVKLDGSNINNTSKVALTTKLSEGADLKNPTNTIVTDTIVKAGLDRKLDKTTYEADKQTLHTDLSKKANTDASNINVGKYTEKLSEKANLTTPTNSLVTDTKVKEYLNANYYTNTEIDKKISNVTVETKGDITSSTLEIKNGTDRLIGTENVSIELKNKAISKEKLSDTLASEIDNKANKNLDNIGNIADKAKTTLTEALGTGTVTEHDTHLVTGKTVHEALKGKADADLSNVSKDTIMEKVSKGNVTSTTLKITNGENAALHAMTVDLKEGSIEKKHLGEGLSKTIDDLEDKVETHDIAIKALKNNKADKVETEKALNNLNENLNNEVKDRKSADRILKKAIEKEEVARKEADKAMEEKVNQEIVRSVAKDKEHDKAISTIAKQSIQNTKNINYIHNAVQKNKQAIANNARRIEAVDRKVNKTAALSTAMASLDFGKVKTGKIAVGAGIGGYHNEQAVAVGVAYQPTEDLLLTAKFSGVTGNPKYNSYGASVSYQFSVK